MKFIDLKDTIHAETHDQVYLDEVGEVLDWLDAHLDQLTGRTITESELIAAVDETNHEDMNEYQKARALLVHLGHTVPEPKPTNLERLKAMKDDWLRESRSHELFIEYLDRMGGKAPEVES